MEYTTFKNLAGQLTGIDLANYKSQQMDRRIQSLMQVWHIENYEDFLTVLQNNPTRFQEFQKKLTINVSEFFRNPDRFQELWHKILPALAEERWQIRIWSAGCSNGAEPYSVAIIATELNLDHRVQILATDIDQVILSQAAQAVYSVNDLKNLPADLLEKYFERQNEQFRLKPVLKRLVEFKRQDLLADTFEANLDLIICRNVVIYFTEIAKRTLYLKFFESLRPGGYLLVGGTEPLLNYKLLGFESGLPSFYRKPATPEGKV